MWASSYWPRYWQSRFWPKQGGKPAVPPGPPPPSQSRYWQGGYWAIRYWPRTGGIIVPPPPPPPPPPPVAPIPDVFSQPLTYDWIRQMRSSFIKTVAYNAFRGFMQLTYKSGQTALYQNITPDLAEAFTAASAQDKFFAETILGKFPVQ